MSVFPRAHAPTRATAPPVARGRTGAGLSLARSPFPPLEVSAADFHTRSAPGVLRRSSGTPVSRRTADTLAGTHPPSAWRPPGCRASGGPPRARAWPRLPERQCAATRAAGHCSAHSTACLHRAVEQAAVDAIRSAGRSGPRSDPAAAQTVGGSLRRDIPKRS